MKRKDKKNKVFLVVALILCITIGYAALTTTLNITGNSDIKSARWDIHFDNLVVDSASVEATTPATIDSAKTAVNYVVKLAKPGDIYAFTVDVVNDGTIDGMVSVVSNDGLTAEQKKYIEYSITYADGTKLQEKDSLKAGAKKNIRVKVKYKDDINPEDLPQEDKTIDLTFTVKHVQADNTVTQSPVFTMKSYTYGSNDDYHNSIYKSKVTKIVTKTNINVPSTAKEQWDVSATGDGSVVAYIEDDGTGNGTYKVTIGGNGGKIGASENLNGMFNNFSELNEIDLSNFDTSNVTNMSQMFYGCGKLASADLSSFDTSKVTNMNYMFQHCTALTSLKIDNFNTSSVTSMKYMFYDCSKLRSLDLSKWDTSKVTNMSYMFYMCGSLTNVDVSKLNTANVTDMSYMFQDCSSLDGLDVSKWDTGKVTNMQNMFFCCTSLTNIGVWDTSNVNNVSGLFCGCAKLIATITIRKNSDFDMIPSNSSIATEPGSQLTVNYTSDTAEVVDQFVSYKSTNTNWNVAKGSLVS